jgi:hypothetical protein
LKGNKLDPATSFCFASPSKKQETTKPKNPQKIKQKTNKNIVAESWVLFFFLVSYSDCRDAKQKLSMGAE